MSISFRQPAPVSRFGVRHWLSLLLSLLLGIACALLLFGID